MDASTLSHEQLVAAFDAAQREIRSLTAQLHAAESDQGLQLLADVMPQMVWITRPDGYHEFYNRRWWDYTGLTYGQARGAGWNTVVHPDDATRADELWQTALRTGEPYEVEYRLKRAADGEHRWFLGRALPARDESGNIVKWFGTCTDIHDQKSSEETVRAAKTDAERVIKARDEFLSVMSHELRTPLSAILGWLQVIEMGVLSPAELKEAYATIKDNAKQQVQLIENMLDVSRILNNKLRMRLMLVELYEPIEAAVRAINPEAAEKGVRVQIDALNRELLVNGDSARIQQVASNLLSNAVKFTPRGGTVRVRLERSQTCCRLEVKDDGAGIDSEVLPHVFDRFRQGDSSHTRRHGGVGLGLAIAHHLVTLHGGTIHAASAGRDQGATFTVLLPSLIEKPEETDPIVFPASAASLLPGPDVLAGLRVLVVDDEESARTLIGLTLEGCGATVTMARSGKEALEQIDGNLCDVVISDIAMNDIDGYEFVSRLRRLDPALANLPAVALTAYASLEDRHKALDAGFDIHVSKPVEVSELVGAIRKLVPAK